MARLFRWGDGARWGSDVYWAEPQLVEETPPVGGEFPPPERHVSQYIEYISPQGDSVILDSGGEPYVLLPNPKGLINNSLSAYFRSSPGQRGSTATRAKASSKSISVAVQISAYSHKEYWELREELAKVLFVPTTKHRESVEPGRLRLFRTNGLPIVEVDAIPVESPSETARPDRLSVVVDIEWEIPSPYWRDVTRGYQRLEAGGGVGLTFPVTFPMSSAAIFNTKTIDNCGHMDSPLLMRLHGPFVNGVISNDRTGERVEIIDEVLAGQYIEVNTRFGHKYVRKFFGDGTWNNAISNTGDNHTFWSALRGTQSVTWSPESTMGSIVELWWDRMVAGV